MPAVLLQWRAPSAGPTHPAPVLGETLRLAISVARHDTRSISLDMQVNACILGCMTAGPADDERVFKALADASRRRLLDLLYEANGQTLGELCQNLDMKRQSVTQHLGLLEDANLISTVWRGREKLHFINPVPLHDVYERWVRKFEEGRLSLLYDLKHKLERNEK